MTTARTLFAEGMRDHLAPALRAMGFTGWRHTFALPDEEHWALLGIELGVADDHLVRYTVNLGLTPKSAWAADRSRRALRPNPNAVTGLESWRTGIGGLLPVGGDVWWQITPGPRWAVAVQDTVSAVRHYGLPELLRRLETASGATEGYLAPEELVDVNAALRLADVAPIRRTELTGRTLRLYGDWSPADPVAREVLRGAATGFLSVGDTRFAAVGCRDTAGRDLWSFGA
ncbi:DUF4304 domain-containing protein [Kitasatospora sp. DSM 101779]|uniref:DUF4304 domain-containing protein n=1 Tax=Kitasatospora sp. DSM 101779 TaxID=2853165 RepID=UPI0021DAD08F|nr:DUF4304 domain-containing protein [Kitasatospora sp. DSM 101779]MCU7824014.1 DUF4304 domain-containing protein [Kitasatospora sp. DSM 101779]